AVGVPTVRVLFTPPGQRCGCEAVGAPTVRVLFTPASGRCGCEGGERRRCRCEAAVAPAVRALFTRPWARKEGAISGAARAVPTGRGWRRGGPAGWAGGRGFPDRCLR